MMLPNTMVMDWATAVTVANNPKVIGLFSGWTNPTTLDLLTVFKNRFGLTPIIAGCMYNSAAEGATDSLAPIWGKHCLLAYVNPKIRLKSLNLGWTFDWGGRLVTSWPNNDPRGKWLMTEEQGLAEELFEEKCGYLIKNAISS